MRASGVEASLRCPSAVFRSSFEAFRRILQAAFIRQVIDVWTVVSMTAWRPVERSAGCEPLFTVPGDLFKQFGHEAVRSVGYDVDETVRPVAQAAR